MMTLNEAFERYIEYQQLKYSSKKVKKPFDESRCRGIGLEEKWSMFLYSSSDYTDASKFGLLKYCDNRNRLILPLSYSYEIYEGATMNLPIQTKGDADVVKGIVDIEGYEFHYKGECYKTLVDRTVVNEWFTAKKAGTIDRILQTLEDVNGELKKLPRAMSYLKKGRGSLSLKQIVKAVRKLIDVVMLDDKNQVRIRYSDKVTHFKVIKEIPFMYEPSCPFMPQVGYIHGFKVDLI